MGEEMMKLLRRRSEAPARPASTMVQLSSAGDTLLAEWHPGDLAEEEKARSKFDEVIGHSFAYADPQPGVSRQIRVFDPSADRIVVVAPLTGG